MTNNHVLNQDFFNNNTDLKIEYKKDEKIIPLNNRIKYTTHISNVISIKIK